MIPKRTVKKIGYTNETTVVSKEKRIKLKAVSTLLSKPKKRANYYVSYIVD